MKAIIPAAGLGTRFLPATKSIPKELLPVLNKPVIQYVVEEALEPEGVDGDATHEVEVFLARDVPHVRAVAVVNHEVRRLGECRAQVSLVILESHDVVFFGHGCSSRTVVSGIRLSHALGGGGSRAAEGGLKGYEKR